MCVCVSVCEWPRVCVSRAFASMCACAVAAAARSVMRILLSLLLLHAHTEALHSLTTIFFLRLLRIINNNNCSFAPTSFILFSVLIICGRRETITSSCLTHTHTHTNTSLHTIKSFLCVWSFEPLTERVWEKPEPQSLLCVWAAREFWRYWASFISSLIN